jgi:hypothetical protein
VVALVLAAHIQLPINTMLKVDVTTHTRGVLKASFIHMALYHPRDENIGHRVFFF